MSRVTGCATGVARGSLRLGLEVFLLANCSAGIGVAASVNASLSETVQSETKILEHTLPASPL